MDFEGQTESLGTLCGEMESLGIDNFNDLIVGKWLQRQELEVMNTNWASVHEVLGGYKFVTRPRLVEWSQNSGGITFRGWLNVLEVLVSKHLKTLKQRRMQSLISFICFPLFDCKETLIIIYNWGTPTIHFGRNWLSNWIQYCVFISQAETKWISVALLSPLLKEC